MHSFTYRTLGCLCMTTFLLAGGPSLAEPTEIKLWPEGHPANSGEGVASEMVRPQRLVVHHSPSILAYLPDENATGAACMICPGGGYSVLAMDHEGTQVAEWLNERGVAAFVLQYRCGGAPNGHPAPLDDALRGMRLIRSHAEEWNIDPNKLGVWGFSAGGHLASCVTTLSDEGDSEADDAVNRHSSRPAFSILAYPVIAMNDEVTHRGSRHNLLGPNPDAELATRLSTDLQVNEQTPPTFLVHATDDTAVVPENSLRFYQALVKAKVPAELHLYESGGHGFGMNRTGKPVDAWTTALERWLASRGYVN